MPKARRIRKISVFTSGGKFSVFTLSYVNTALNQSAFRIYKCYIMMKNISRTNAFPVAALTHNIYSISGGGGGRYYSFTVFNHTLTLGFG